MVAGLCDGTDGYTGALVLLLQSLLSNGSVIARLVEEHALEVEPDAMAEEEAGRGGHDYQIHEPFGVLRISPQVERAQLGMKNSRSFLNSEVKSGFTLTFSRSSIADLSCA